MASDTDFQFIMGTVFGQKQDSPLFKALEKAGIADIGGITSLTNRVIDRLKYRDDSSGTPLTKELGHGYQQLIRCFNAFVLMKNDEGNRIHGDWQNLTIITEFQEFLNHRFCFVHLRDTGLDTYYGDTRGSYLWQYTISPQGTRSCSRIQEGDQT
jgi:hypothetical protein